MINVCYAYNQPLNRPATLSSSFTREIPSVGEEEEQSGWLCCPVQGGVWVVVRHPADTAVQFTVALVNIKGRASERR